MSNLDIERQSACQRKFSLLMMTYSPIVFSETSQPATIAQLQFNGSLQIHNMIRPIRLIRERSPVQSWVETITIHPLLPNDQMTSFLINYIKN